MSDLSFAELERLALQAEQLKGNGEASTDLARQLRLQANQHYGINSRDPYFSQILQLAGDIDQREKKNWKSELTILGRGRYDLTENENFQLTRYIFGRADLFLNDKCVERLYGVSVEMLFTSSAIPTKRLHSRVFNLEPETRSKFIRANKLENFLKKEFSQPLIHSPVYQGNRYAYQSYVSQVIDISAGNEEVFGDFHPDFSSEAAFHASMKIFRRSLESGIVGFLREIHYVRG